MPKTVRSFLTAGWHHLVMLNFVIDPEILRRRVPPGTELDFWNGRTYVSLVGFRFLDTKLLGWPIPFHRHFSEVNLRFYVRRRVDNQWRRGVVFIKEIVPLHAVSLVARWIYNENYVTLGMRHRIELPTSGGSETGTVGYSWRWRGRWMHITAEMSGDARSLAPGSEEEFIAEHYWGYAGHRSGGTTEYQVEHPPWKVWQASNPQFECDIGAFYGTEFVDCVSGTPTSAFIADGSPIVVRQGQRLRL